VDAPAPSAPGRPLPAPTAVGLCRARVGKPQTRRLKLRQTNLLGPRTLLWTLPPQDFLHDSFFIEFTVIPLRPSTTILSATHLLLWMPKPARNDLTPVHCWCGWVLQKINPEENAETKSEGDEGGINADSRASHSAFDLHSAPEHLALEANDWLRRRRSEEPDEVCSSLSS
jgi:hypothetical protein